MKGKVLISKDEYLELLITSGKFYNLESMGVDNWSGYEECDFIDEEVLEKEVAAMEEFNG